MSSPVDIGPDALGVWTSCDDSPPVLLDAWSRDDGALTSAASASWITEIWFRNLPLLRLDPTEWEWRSPS
jgi:hypothetical protein